MARASTTKKADPSLERHAAALYDALSELIRVYQFRDRDRICTHGISVTQCYALDALARSGPLTMNALAGRLYLDKSTVSRVVSTLEQKKLIERRQHSEDGRAILLECSRKGRELHERIRLEIQDREKRLIADFDPEVRAAMIELIDRLARAAEERVSSTGGTCCSID
jgi:MarR family 2-MHQ and catechol resistance regulon transcriptional repressor